MAERLVIDASVAAEWFLRDEPDVDLADRLLDAALAQDLEVHVPMLFRYEMATLLAQDCGTRDPQSGESRLHLDEAKAAVLDLEDLPLTIHAPTVAESLGSIELAVRYSMRFRDMTYVWLAEVVGSRWCTAGAKVLRGRAAGFPFERVVLLSSFREEETDSPTS